ncbi:MAG: RNA methyltransferase [Bacteroidales bacterium]|nr:RNA methyltransferase [Bacteroidales bacterium]
MITDIDNLAVPELAAYASLTETQLRNRLDPEMGIFIAESPNVIKAALKAGCEPLSLLTERRHLEGTAKEVIELLGDGIPIFTGDRDTLAQLTGYELTRGVLCAMRRPQPKTTSEVCSGKRRIAVIDSVVNATNTGAIFRAAAALGIEAVLLSPSCSDPLNRRCVRVSMGTVFQVPWGWIDVDRLNVDKLDGDRLDDAGWVKQLHELGFTTVAMALREDALPIDDPRLKTPERIAIVIGNEGDGLSQQTIDSCDLVGMIPMRNGVDSLNVAAAAAVAFWEMRIR